MHNCRLSSSTTSRPHTCTTMRENVFNPMTNTEQPAALSAAAAELATAEQEAATLRVAAAKGTAEMGETQQRLRQE